MMKIYKDGLCIICSSLFDLKEHCESVRWKFVFYHDVFKKNYFKKNYMLLKIKENNNNMILKRVPQILCCAFYLKTDFEKSIADHRIGRTI